MSTPHKSHNPGFLALVNDAKSRVKEVKSEVLKDSVVLTGSDRIRREIKFKTSL